MLNIDGSGQDVIIDLVFKRYTNKNRLDDIRLTCTSYIQYFLISKIFLFTLN